MCVLSEANTQLNLVLRSHSSNNLKHVYALRVSKEKARRTKIGTEAKSELKATAVLCMCVCVVYPNSPNNPNLRCKGERVANTQSDIPSCNLSPLEANRDIDDVQVSIEVQLQLLWQENEKEQEKAS